MVLTKDELISALNHEVHLLLHLASKIEPGNLDYRPTPSQRSVLELLQYLTVMGPIHLRGVMADHFDMGEWRSEWTKWQAVAKAMDLDQAKAEIARHRSLFQELLAPCSDDDLRKPIEMFGSKASRGSMIVRLVLSHYTAYRMQLFLYLKECGHEQLNTLNLWMGIDGSMQPPPVDAAGRAAQS